MKQALPTVEHFVPLLVAYGAGYDDNGGILPASRPATTPRGTRRSLQFN